MDVLVNVKLLCVLFVSMCVNEKTFATTKRTHARSSERLNPPLDIELETINCTAVRIKWRIPLRHVSTVTGYKVFYTEMKNGHPASSAVAVNAPLNLAVLTAVRSMAVEVGGLRAMAQYVFSVGAYGWAGEGRPSVPRRVSTLPQEMCVPPAAPLKPLVMAVSDTEVTLSCEQGERKSVSLLRLIVSYIRPEVDRGWTSLELTAADCPVVLRGLDSETVYQFMVQTVNAYGTSLPSAISDPVRTLSMQELGSGVFDQSQPIIPYTDKEQQTELHSDFDISAEEPSLIPVRPNRKSQLKSMTMEQEGMLDDRKIIQSNSPDAKPITTVSTNTTGLLPLSHSPLSSTTPTPTQPSPITSTVSSQQQGQVRGLRDLPCEDTVCPPNRVCVDDYQHGGSHCYCGLGRGGAACSQDVVAQYPKFNSYSHIAFEPLKNSYYKFHIMLEFKPESHNGLLLFCGENEQSDGDYASLALIHGKLHFRFNCGTGSAQLVSPDQVVLGQWHSVVISREGIRGWLKLDNKAHVTGHSWGDYSKITFRTPLYLGGSPNAYWLARTAGTNRGFQGCVQKLKINHWLMDMRPWPIGQALSGADIRECSSAVCEDVLCANGGTCVARSVYGPLCLCPLGYGGHLCQESLQVVLPLFSASEESYASTPWPQCTKHYLSFMEFEVVFQPIARNGTLLHCHDAESQDFLSILLVDGFVELRFDCGSGTALIRSEEPVSLNEWHELWVSRTGKEGILQVDNLMPTRGMAQGAFTQITCISPLYIGGTPHYSRNKPQTGLHQSFTGSIQKVTVNGQSIRLPHDLSSGVNIDNAPHPCLDNPCVNGGTCRPRHSLFSCVCPLGFAGTHCHRVPGSSDVKTTDDSAVPQFTGRSYLSYDNRDMLKRLSGFRTYVSLRFRSRVQDGLLLWRGHTNRQDSDFMALGLKGGALVFSYNLGSGVAIVIVNGSFSDGHWHRVQAVRVGQYGRLTVDQSQSSTGQSPGNTRLINSNALLFVGGMKEVGWRFHSQAMLGLVGCISHLSLSTDRHVNLLEDAASAKNIDVCSP